MSWYVEGENPNRQSFVDNAYHAKLFNFWMKKGETKELVFFDDARFGLYEHKMQVNGKWRSFTCGEACYLCGLEKPRGYSEYYTIVDLTPFKDKEGKEHKFSRRPLSVGKGVSELLTKRRQDCGGSLVGAKFKVSRTGEKSPGCGNDWVYVTKVEPSKFPADMKAIDFRDALKPRPTSEIQSILSWSGGGESAAGTVRRDDLAAGIEQPPMGDEEVPF